MTSGSSARVTAWDLAERAICRDGVNELHAADDERQWEELGFTDGERDVWVSSGMPRRLAHVARARVDHGIAPSDLQRPVGAMTVVELLEAGEAPGSRFCAALAGTARAEGVVPSGLSPGRSPGVRGPMLRAGWPS